MKQLARLQNEAKKKSSKIVYYGIEFVENSDTMKKIGSELNGKTCQPKTGIELMEAF